MNKLSKEELLALGFSYVGDDVLVSRRAVFHAITGSLGDGARIDDFAVLTGNLKIGRHTHISPFCFLGGTGGCITLEAGVGLSTHVSIFTKSDDYQYKSDGPRNKIQGDVIVQENTIFGSQCVILPGSIVGSNCSVGVGCVINGVIPSFERLVSVGIRSVSLP